MSSIEKMKSAKAIADLELYEIVVALYPERFAEREEAGEDLWDEVMEFVEGDLICDLLSDEYGLRQFIGRMLLLTHPVCGSVSGGMFHVLGSVEVVGNEIRMIAHAKAEVKGQ